MRGNFQLEALLHLPGGRGILRLHRWQARQVPGRIHRHSAPGRPIGFPMRRHRFDAARRLGRR